MADLILKPSSGSGNKVRIQDQTGADNLIIDADASMTGVKPHIIPNKLYPAVAGKLLDGSTSHSGNYGTAQSDGRSYYYTDIKGSKPIKDPRIGGHFGSQRYPIRSIQLLEQETATYGENVYSIDGREYFRVWGEDSKMINDSNGEFIHFDTSNHGYVEIVGYLSGLNMHVQTLGGTGMVYKIDGGSFSAEQTTFQTSVTSPLRGRYVNAGSLVNVFSDQTLGIHTVQLRTHATGDDWYLHGIELIAHEKFTDATCDYNNDPTITHDANTRIVAGLTVTGTGIPANATVASVTSSTEFELSAATTGGAVTNGTLTFGTNNIQIPSQNVVSYGKKFTVSDNPHYDPFNGFTNDTTEFSSRVDVATSLGLGTATTWGAAWDKGSDNHIRPYNGGRVVKWVDASGNIKTSVTMMPANAQNVGNNQSAGSAGTASNEILTASATNSQTINFSDDVIDHSLSEVAKSFLPFEFGNGAANGGVSGTWLDCSMLDDSGSRDIAYVMDDGLTSLSGEDVRRGSNDYIVFTTGTSDFWYLTFIGTGITLGARNANVEGDRETIAQNLPYGTHILKLESDSSTHQTTKITIDGILVKTTSSNNNFEYGGFYEITFHQPKKPPIPEEAVVLADYMLMADTVSASGSVDIMSHISKGVRRISCSRDFFYDASSGTPTVTLNTGYPSGILQSHGGSINGGICRLPYFGTNYQPISMSSKYSTVDKGGSTDVTVTEVGSTAPLLLTSSAHTLGQYDGQTDRTTSGDFFNFGAEIVSPIHTSFHYQTFETPFLHELVGGDRNMEQHNLVVTPDGKTWDEVTRDTSYNGNIRFHASDDGQDANPIILSDFRGVHRTNGNYYQKNFAIAYDRFICLKEGQYEIKFSTYNNTTSTHAIKINGTDLHGTAMGDTEENVTTADAVVSLKRGDYVQIRGKFWNQEFTHFSITEI